MRIGLVDVDSHNFPNLVLMKLSAYFKNQGHEVELLQPWNILKGCNLFFEYDKLYGACVFDWNRNTANALRKFGVKVHGTGTSSKVVLPHKIEHVMPDYSLYGISDTAYGFLTRGCPRHCPFCIVGNKEGLISQKVADLTEFWEGQKFIQILDPNILACDRHIELLEQLAECGAKVEFNQGLDARLLTEENIEMLKRIKIKRIHFAWDNPKDKVVPKMLEMFAKVWKLSPKSKSVVVYVLVNYWSSHEEDLERIYWLREHAYMPYVMIYNKASAPRETRLLQRWCNNKILFGAVKRFEDYDPKKA